MVKGKGKKKGKASADAEVDENQQENEERLKLIDQLSRLKKEIEKEETTSADFKRQLEKLKYFWEIEKEKLEKKKSESQTKKWTLKELDEKHRNEIGTYKQKLKHLLFEQQNQITRSKTDTEVVLKLNQDHNRFEEAELKNDKKDLNARSKEEEISHDRFLRKLRSEHERDLTTAQNEYTRRASELTVYSENVLKTTRETLERERKGEVLVIEKRKNEQAKELTESHEEDIDKMRLYYNSVTQKNLDLIKSLKDQHLRTRKTERHNDKLLTEVTTANKKIVAPLSEATNEIATLTKARERYTDEKAELKKTERLLRRTENDLEASKWRHEVLFQRFSHVDDERRALDERYLVVKSETRRRYDFRHLLLEKKVTCATNVGEQYTAALSEILTRANFEPEAVLQVQSRLTNVVEVKNAEIFELEGELKRVREARRRLVERVKGKMEEYEIPLEEIGLRSSSSSPSKKLKG